MPKDDVIVERLQSGTKPTQILREMKAANPRIGNHELARNFCEWLGGAPIDAVRAIWYWKDGGKAYGYDDEKVDANVMQALREENLI